MSDTPRSRGRAVPFTATLLMLSLHATGVLGAELEHHPKVALRVSSCSEAFETALRRMLAIELGELLEDARPEDASNLETIEIACEADKAKISARSVAGDQVERNDLRFDAFPSDAAPRAVALAALEALRAVDPTLTERLAAQRAQAQASGAPSVPPSAPSTHAPARGATRPATAARAENTATSRPAIAPRPFTRLTLGAGVRHFLAAPTTTLLGLRLELSRRFSAPLDVGLDLDGAISRRQVTLGTVEARLLSTAAWLGARAGSADWSATAGLGARVGLVNLEGTPDPEARGHRVLRPLAGALLVVRGDGAMGPIALAIAGEGGYALVGAQGLAAHAPALELDGFWLAISANAGLRFWL